MKFVQTSFHWQLGAAAVNSTSADFGVSIEEGGRLLGTFNAKLRRIKLMPTTFRGATASIAAHMAESKNGDESVLKHGARPVIARVNR